MAGGRREVGRRRRAPGPLVAPLALAACLLAACSGSDDVASAGAPGASTPPTSRPSATPSGDPTPSGTPASPTAAAPSAAPTPTTITYAFPISPASRAHFSHSHHDYPATDVFARCGTTFVAVTSGRVVEVSTVDRWNAKTDLGADRGGLSVMLLGDDGVRYYGSHLSAVQPGITVGRRVAAGDVLGKVGRSGNAAGVACHVHFGLSPACAEVKGEWWIRRGTIYPWPYLESWRKGGELSPVKAVAAWHDKHGCPANPSVDP